jgi:hypothetical protein
MAGSFDNAGSVPVFPSEARPPVMGDDDRDGHLVHDPMSLSRWAVWAFLVAAAVYLDLIIFVLPRTPI